MTRTKAITAPTITDAEVQPLVGDFAKIEQKEQKTKAKIEEAITAIRGRQNRMW